ncbi:hypothetical protein [Streptomyces sp. MMG1121]|uniref:hypothetical protein n=1 Tax=Streptomyces sp. MMG1121 TaxID=1415544 RepID=UPI0006B059BC|nr:hypothetical protein [Streptomyces sp. MMG1121]KOV59659.1 hypothetical protein ADK64_32760 [Streptomyces sp. MMG1121]
MLSSFQVGTSQDYTAYGMNAGNISQLYDSCTGDTIAEWIWAYSFVQAHGDSYIQVSIASMGSNQGATTFPSWEIRRRLLRRTTWSLCGLP